MEEKATVPYFVYESALARSEQNTKRLLIALVICIIVIFASNAVWLFAWMQFEYVGEEVTVDGTDGIASYVNRGGMILNGEDNG